MSLHLDVSPQAEARFNSVALERGIEPEQLFEEMVEKMLPAPQATQEIPAKGKMITRGMFPQLAGLDEDDFKIAEFHGDDDDGLDWN